METAGQVLLLFSLLVWMVVRTTGLNVDLQGGDSWLSVAVVYVIRVDGCENHRSECRV